MPSPITATLSPRERKIVMAWFAELNTDIIANGSELLEKGRVLSASWCDDHAHLHGAVKDVALREPVITFEEDDTISTECTCLARRDCKHAVAVLLAASSGRTGATSATPSVAAATTVQARAPELCELEREVTTRVQHPLQDKAVRSLKAIQRWWDKKVRLVTEGDFRTMTGAQNLWARNNKPLFPKKHPPQSAWELLHYVDHVAHELKLALPNPISSALDRELQRGLVKVWEEERALKAWEATMEKWASNVRERALPEVPRFRLRLQKSGAIVEWKPPGAQAFAQIKITPLREWCGAINSYRSTSDQVEALRQEDRLVLQAAGGGYNPRTEIPANDSNLLDALTRLLRSAETRATVVSETGEELPHHTTALRWDLREVTGDRAAYALHLLDADGTQPPVAMAVLHGRPMLYVTSVGTWEVNAWPFELADMQWPQVVPASVLESRLGATVLEHLGVPMPQRLAERIVVVKPRVTISCRLHCLGSTDYLRMSARAEYGSAAPEEKWNGKEWQVMPRTTAPPDAGDKILRIDSSVLPQAGAWVNEIGAKFNPQYDYWERRVPKEFPEEFLAWIARRPDGIEVQLDPELASLRDGKISAMVKLDVEESGIDWFDLKVTLDVNDTTLLPGELDLLLKAKGKWVRLGGRGWRKLEYLVTEEEEKQLADMGLAVSEFDGQPQRLHALQLAGASSKNSKLLPAERAAAVRLRAEEIQTRVAPAVPPQITATLRPYQQEGFHFLAYLTANHFGGVLADDMGLGKTIQTLAWLAWLCASNEDATVRRPPSLVVCPKSVQDNWHAEAVRFFPSLKVEMWSRDNAGDPVPDDCDLLVIHYQHLRMHEDMITRAAWDAVILDEAQAIKNPSSQTAVIAGKLRAQHRLALTGTPIENRLLDLWSIMSFAMPGVLGNRAQFTKNFDAKGDPFARLRLAARVRPFLLRRTKKEVASDLPDRIEEDLACELEGVQQKLYSAELKRARAQLLKLKTSKELDKARFNILTSLLRLRQICCHPKLVGCDDPKATSAKLDALTELLDPLMQEGHKVIVFSQFVDMIHLIEDELRQNEWPHFILTGTTDDRGALVNEFQTTEGAAVFLISLKAGGFGLNLTAASYVVLFDPWWNPAVEAQAIDRTHRIGQTRTVIAYRLIMKETIEEKIRLLQKQKGALANDILGEENFAKALTLDDFRFLLGET